MGNSQSSENPDVYTYHESVLKQGAEAAGSNSSDESEDEMQEGFSREASTSSFVQNEDDIEKNETNLNFSEDENSDSEENVIIVPIEGVEVSDENLEDSSLHQEAREGDETENEAVALSNSTALKHTLEHENSEFVTPPSSPSLTEPSPGPARRSSRLQLKTSTLNTTSKKRPRLSMRDSDDSDDGDTQYSTPPVTRKTPASHLVNNISVQSQRSSSKNLTENSHDIQLTTPKARNEENTSKSPSSNSEMIATSAPPSNDNGRPNLRSTGGEARPFLRAKRSVQLFGKNAVHLQKVVSIRPTSKASVEVSNSSNDESNSCTGPTANNLDSQSEQPASASSESISVQCTASSMPCTAEMEIESTTVASTQGNQMSETLQNPARVTEVASSSKDNAVSNSSTPGNLMSEALPDPVRLNEVASTEDNVVLNSSTAVTCTASKSTSSVAEVDDVIMRDVNIEKESNTPRNNIDSEEISASGSNSVQPIPIQFVDNSKNMKSVLPKPMEVVTAAEEQPLQNSLPVFGSINNMSCTSAVDVQPSQARVSSRPLSFSELINSQVAASSISNVGSSSMALVLPSQHQTPRSSPSTFGQASQTPTPTPSVSSSATCMSYPHHPQTSTPGPNFNFGQTSYFNSAKSTGPRVKG